MKKEFKQIDLLTEEDVVTIDELSTKITKKFYVNTISSTIIVLIFLILTTILYSTARVLSVISKEVYFVIILFSLLFYIGITIKYYLTKEKDLNALKTKKSYYSIIDLVGFVIKSTIISLFCLVFVVSTAKVSGDSMLTTYNDNDTILVWSLFYEPKLNDVVVVDSTNLIHNSEFIIKRVVATEFDKIEHKNNALYVNDVLIQEMDSDMYRTLLTDKSSNKSYAKVPDGFYILLGDNRGNSLDSRNIGLVSNEEIVGKSIFRILPFKNIGIPK